MQHSKRGVGEGREESPVAALWSLSPGASAVQSRTYSAPLGGKNFKRFSSAFGRARNCSRGLPRAIFVPPSVSFAAAEAVEFAAAVAVEFVRTGLEHVLFAEIREARAGA